LTPHSDIPSPDDSPCSDSPSDDLYRADYSPASQTPSTTIPDRNTAYQAALDRGSISWVAARPFLNTLGIGGQGTVILAERRGAGQFSLPVALKFFSPERFPSVDEYDAEMIRQAEVSSRVARIQDDHLVDVHAFIEESGIYYMEMEWIDGFDLLHILRRDTLDIVQDAVTERRWKRINKRIVTGGQVDCRLKPGMAVALIRECLAGVSALHRDGIVHCDLKPSNVMVKRTGQVKIIDTGSAFWIGRAPVQQPCTLEYAAPEILEGFRATTQSDLASLGYMLIEMLTGARPFAGLAWDELIEAKHTLPTRLTGILPQDEFPYIEPLTHFLQRLIDPDPARRFPTAEEAELSDRGAAGFLNDLVKSDRGEEYASELRQWITEMESNSEFRNAVEPDLPTTATTRTVQSIPETRIMRPGDLPDSDAHGFNLH